MLKKIVRAVLEIIIGGIVLAVFEIGFKMDYLGSLSNLIAGLVLLFLAYAIGYQVTRCGTWISQITKDKSDG